MQELDIDLETYSSVNLITQGLYKYVQSTDFEILLFAYKVDNKPTKIVDLASGESIPYEIICALTDPKIKKFAHNAQFERICLNKHFGIAHPIKQWHCTMVMAAQLGLPLDLDTCAQVLNLTNKKDRRGRAYIRLFCCPNKTTQKKDCERIRIYPTDKPVEWKGFKRYCVGDVDAEHELKSKISFMVQPPIERALYCLDQRINDRGIRIDKKLIQSAIELDEVNSKKLLKEAVLLTGLENPKSVSQLKKWLFDVHEIEVDSLNKIHVPKIIANTTSKTVKKVLELRKEFSRTSIKKFKKMIGCITDADLAHGLIQFYGAGRTGRWAGRLIQVHNLVKNYIDALACARQMVRDGDTEMLTLMYGRIGYVLSQIMRTAFIAHPGKRFIISDFKAIEARVLAWLANQEWRLKIFREGGDIYKASASAMFHIPLDKITSEDRQKGKVAELSLGYQGSVGAIARMDTDEKIPVHARKPLVNAWRKANPDIVQYWYDVEAAAISAIQGLPVEVGNVSFRRDKKALFITLPSGRKLTYLKAHLVVNERGRLAIRYKGMNQYTHKWGTLELYGGKIVENITQAIARDLLGEAMLRLDKAGYPIVMHVHDEVIAELLKHIGSVKEMDRIMCIVPDWAEGLPIGADTFESTYYYKAV